MPLHPVNLAQKYPATLSTIGPAREEWGDAILEFVHDFWKNQYLFDVGFPRLKFEVSNDGYPHFHLALMFAVPSHNKAPKYAMFARRMKNFLRAYQADKRSLGYDPKTELSFRMYAVPVVETHNAKVLRGAALMHHYLDTPTKEKSTDGKDFTIELDGFNVAQYLAERNLWVKAMQSELDTFGHIVRDHVFIPPPTRPVNWHSLSYGRDAQEHIDELTAHLNEINTWVCKFLKLKLPDEFLPLTQRLVECRPSMKFLLERHAVWQKISSKKS